MKVLICFFVGVLFSSTNAWKCPTHCFCYIWRNLKRTDCVGKNLYNTFVGFSHETQFLDLSRNAISILHGNEFLDANLKDLKSIILSNNRIYIIDKLTFNGLEYLEYLDLSYNSLEYLTPTTFDFNPNLKVLNVSNNPLAVKDEPFLLNAPSLQVLKLANDNLRFLTVQTFSNLENLQVLDIRNNRIQKINVEVLTELTQLKVLEISGNDLICNDNSMKLKKWLLSRNVQFRSFCPNSEILPGSTLHLEEPTAKLLNERKATRIVTTTEKSFYENVARSIPTLYAMLWGMQVGILMGALLTYLCWRKPARSQPVFIRTRSRNRDRSRLSVRSSRFDNTDPDTSTIALVPLNTPPGTPPSPYHSRTDGPLRKFKTSINDVPRYQQKQLNSFYTDFNMNRIWSS